MINACHDQSAAERGGSRSRSARSRSIALIRADDYATVVNVDELERGFLQLPIEHRAVLVLTHYVGMSAPEVGQVLGIPAGTVYSRLHYGIRAMRAALSKARLGPAAALPEKSPMNEMRLDPVVAKWLSDGPDEGPEHGLKRAFAATRTGPPASGWTFPRGGCRRRSPTSRCGAPR